MVAKAWDTETPATYPPIFLLPKILKNLKVPRSDCLNTLPKVPLTFTLEHFINTEIPIPEL